MRCPVSSRGLMILVEELSEGAVLVEVEGGAVLPAVPDDVEPGSGEDPGGGGDTGQAGQRFGGGEPAAAVADLGEQPGGADGARTGQAGEDVSVGMQGELLSDVGRQGVDLVDQCGEDGQQGVGDVGLGVAVVAGCATGGGDEPGVQLGGVDPAAVADAGQPRGQTFRAEPVGPVLAVEPGQERQADRGVNLGEQPDGAGEGGAEVGAELVGHRDPVVDQVFAGPAG